MRHPLMTVAAGLAALGALAGCGTPEPTARDVPPDVLQARPSITAGEARFVLAARDQGVTITGGTVSDDIETGTTTCWALRDGGVRLKDLAAEISGSDAARTKGLMYAAVQALCPQFSSQLGELGQLDKPTG